MRIEVNEEAGRRCVDDPASSDTAVVIEQHDVAGSSAASFDSGRCGYAFSNYERVRS
jgi:hypothetical protein